MPLDKLAGSCVGLMFDSCIFRFTCMRGPSVLSDVFRPSTSAPISSPQGSVIHPHLIILQIFWTPSQKAFISAQCQNTWLPRSLSLSTQRFIRIPFIYLLRPIEDLHLCSLRSQSNTLRRPVFHVGSCSRCNFMLSTPLQETDISLQSLNLFVTA